MGNSSSSRSRDRFSYDPSLDAISGPSNISRRRSAQRATGATNSNNNNLLAPPTSGHRRTRSTSATPRRPESILPPPPYSAKDDSALIVPQSYTPSATLSERAQYLQRPMRKETEEDALETLIKFNTVLVVDDSSSMRGSRWAEARQALSGLARKAGLYDTDGIDIYFLNSSKVGLNLKNPQAVEDLFDRVEPRGATPIAGKLEELLQDYVSQIEAVQRDKEKLKQIKPINYIVLTDGAATDDPESIIVHYARRLDRGNFPPSQLGIQFVQIGNSKSATMYLKELDDELAGTHKIRDIVDTTPFTDIGGELNPDILIKILLGGINRRIDKVGARPVH